MKTYEQMKDSGHPWMGKIPSHWRDINPKALFTQRKERAKEGERQLTASQQYGVLYQDEYMALTGSRVVVVQKDFDILKHVEAGDFVISMRSFQGGLEYSPVSGSISSAYVMLIPNKDLVYPPFYKWLLKSSAYIRALQSTTDLVRDGQAMRYSNFAKVRLLTAPIDEQKAIANYLDDHCAQIDSIIEEAKASINTYKKWKGSVIAEAITKGVSGNVRMRDTGVDWIGMMPVNWQCKKIKFFGQQTTERAESNDGFIGLENIESGSGHYVETSDKEIMAEGTSIKIQKGDVIFGKLRPYLAKSYVAEKDCCGSTEFIVIHPFDCVAKYLMYIMLSPKFVDVVNMSTYGAKMPRANWNYIGNIKAPYPPVEEQEEIVRFLDAKLEQIDALIREKKELIKDMEMYRKSLIYEAVTGKRKVV